MHVTYKRKCESQIVRRYRRCIKWDFVWISPSGVVRQSAIKKKRRHNINNSSVKNESRFRHNCSSALSLTGKIFRRPIDTWLYEQIENIHIHQTNDAKEKRKWKTERSILMYVVAVCDSDFFHNQEWILVISYFFPIFETKLFQLIRNFEIIFSRSIINRRVSHHWTNVAKQSELPRNASQIRASNNRITPAESSAITDAVPRKRQIRDTQQRGGETRKKTHLDTVVAGCDSSILHLNIGRGMCELAFGVRAGALVPLELAAHLQLQPARVLAVQQAVHVHHRHRTNVRAPFYHSLLYGLCVSIQSSLGL